MNNVIQGSGIWINSPSSFTSSQCTFSNNKVSEGICIYFYSTSGTVSMSHSNIVHNNSPSLGVVYVDGTGSRKIMNSIFQKNQNYIFCIDSGSLEVSLSFIDQSSSFSTRTSVSAINNSLSTRITYQFQFFNSLHCNADMPKIDKTALAKQRYISVIFYFFYPILFLVIS